MKRVVIPLLVTLFAVTFLLSCGKNSGKNEPDNPDSQEIENIFRTVCSADEALELSKKAAVVVFEDRGCTSGSDVWEAFYQKTTKKEPASVLCAHYYVLDKEHVSEELYEEEKDQFPQLFFYLVEYDGKTFSVKTRESSVKDLESEETYEYLVHMTGNAPDTALYTSYDNYVLVDDPSVTWEKIYEGMYSSQSDAWIRHCTVYRDYLGWKEK